MKTRINEIFESALVFGLAGLFAAALIAEVQAAPQTSTAPQATQMAKAQLAGEQCNG